MASGPGPCSPIRGRLGYRCAGRSCDFLPLSWPRRSEPASSLPPLERGDHEVSAEGLVSRKGEIELKENPPQGGPCSPDTLETKPGAALIPSHSPGSECLPCDRWAPGGQPAPRSAGGALASGARLSEGQRRGRRWPASGLSSSDSGTLSALCLRHPWQRLSPPLPSPPLPTPAGREAMRTDLANLEWACLGTGREGQEGH